MFDRQTIAFLEDLRQTNTRAWFEEHRARYEAHVAASARAFCDGLAGELSQRAGAPVEAKLYRLHRDLRFARDKTPYNTHIHMGFSTPGHSGAWLVGMEPGSLVLGFGLMAFEAGMLDRWRNAVAGEAGEALSGIVAQPGFRLDPPELKRVPAPFGADHPAESLLRRKSLVLWDDSLPVESAFGLEAPARLASRLRAFEPLRGWIAASL